jgi:hypothetical protein
LNRLDAPPEFEDVEEGVYRHFKQRPDEYDEHRDYQSSELSELSHTDISEGQSLESGSSTSSVIQKLQGVDLSNRYDPTSAGKADVGPV